MATESRINVPISSAAHPEHYRDGFRAGWDAAISTTPAPLDAALERLGEDDIDYRTDPAGPTALEPNEPELWVRYAALEGAPHE